jgi:hypothetical protein
MEVSGELHEATFLFFDAYLTESSALTTAGLGALEKRKFCSPAGI